MPYKNLKEKIREMKIEYVKTYWNDELDLNGLTDNDILSIYEILYSNNKKIKCMR